MTRSDGGQSWAPHSDAGAMTNSWNDIKNTDLVPDHGAATPPKAHPCGFKWVTEAKANKRRQADRVDPRFTRPLGRGGPDVYAPIRPGKPTIALPVGRDALPARQTARSTREIRQGLHQRLPTIVKDGYNFPGRACSRATTRRARPTPTARAGTTSSTTRAWPKVDETSAEPAPARNQSPEGPCRALHARDGSSASPARPKAEVSCRSARWIASTSTARPYHDVDVRVGLDAAHDGRPEHPLDGHDPAPAWATWANAGAAA